MRSRLGKKLQKLNTMVMEKHLCGLLYVSIHSNTTDIPVKTSDTLLRKYRFLQTETTKENEGLLGKLIQKLEFADQRNIIC